jgi:hypothetical protein
VIASILDNGKGFMKKRGFTILELVHPNIAKLLVG